MNLPYDRYIELVASSALLHSLKANQLPQLQLALVIILILVAGLIGCVLLLRHEERESRGLHRVIEEMHMEDLQRLKFPEHESEEHGGEE